MYTLGSALFRISPAQNTADNIECELLTIALQTSLAYRVLSYTRGNANETTLITLNDYVIFITQNLEKALHRLRSELGFNILG